MGFEQNLNDRRLGHEWYGWDGNIEAHESCIHEPKRLFLGLLFFTFALTLAAACCLTWVAYPRLTWLHPATGHLVFGVLIGAALLFFMLYATLCVALILRSPSRLAEWTGENLFRIFPLVALVAARLRVSKDRLGYSLIEVHNELTRTRLRRASSGRLLCLAPRCLDKQNLDQVKALTSEYACDFCVAGTGAMARQRVLQLKPAAIIGIACERDLVTGIRDVGYKIPVIGIANKRPHGPCKGAYIDLAELREAIEFFKERFEVTPPAESGSALIGD